MKQRIYSSGNHVIVKNSVRQYIKSAFIAWLTFYAVILGRKKMPFVEVKLFEDELTQEQSKELIQKITNAVTEVTSEKLRDVTWVVISEVKSGNWGVGGNALGLDDVKKIMTG